jgi:hypothetical protein
MTVRSRIVSLVLGLGVSAGSALAALPLLAQEPAAGKAAPAPAPAAKRPFDPSRRVPDFFGQIGLSAEQREQIYKIRARHQPKIDELRQQIEQIQNQMLSECEALLTDTQKQMLTQRRTASPRARRARPAAETTKAAEKTPN